LNANGENYLSDEDKRSKKHQHLTNANLIEHVTSEQREHGIRHAVNSVHQTKVEIKVRFVCGANKMLLELGLQCTRVIVAVVRAHQQDRAERKDYPPNTKL
jgi:hypothetical protein